MKKAWVPGLILVLAVSLCGCGKSADKAPTSISDALGRVEAGLDDLEDHLSKLDEAVGGKSDPEPEHTKPAGPTAQAVQTDPPTQAPEETADALSEDELRPEVKQAIDDTEAFFAEYAEFMASYSASDNSLGMMSDYLSMMQQYADTMESFEAMEEMEMTEAEAKYYAEASLRITQALLDAAG